MVLFGLFWVVVVILVRLVLSFSIGGAGPYSLIYPAILISTAPLRSCAACLPPGWISSNLACLSPIQLQKDR